MSWRTNLLTILKGSKKTDIEIYARTGISTSVLSKMRNLSHNDLSVEQFILLRLYFKKSHREFLDLIFGELFFSEIKKITAPNIFNNFGNHLVDNFHYEELSKKEIARATGIVSTRLDYLTKKNFSNILIEEITCLELAITGEIGSFVDVFFAKIYLHTEEEYSQKLLDKKDRNNNKK